MMANRILYWQEILFDFLPQFGRLDASYGNVLDKQVTGEFTEIPPGKTGISVTGMK